MKEKGYIEWLYILLSGAAAGIVVYEYAMNRSGRRAASPSAAAPVNQSTALPVSPFMNGMFGTLPNSGQGADYIRIGPAVLFT